MLWLEGWRLGGGGGAWSNGAGWPYPDNRHSQSGPIINTQVLTGGSRSCNTTAISGLRNGGGMQGKWEKGEWLGGQWGGGLRSTVPYTAAGCCSPDRFYGHCPRSGPQPPTPRFQLMALPVWVKRQLESWSFATCEEGAINKHLAIERWWAALLCLPVSFSAQSIRSITLIFVCVGISHCRSLWAQIAGLRFSY